jgi:hypothetical protein
MMKTTSSIVVATALACGAFAAQAQDNYFKIGVTRYDTHAKTNGISGIGVPAGADASVGDATTIILVYERRFGGNFGAELVMGIPPTIKAKAAGSVEFLNAAGTGPRDRDLGADPALQLLLLRAERDLAAVRRRRHQLHQVQGREVGPRQQRRHGQLVGPRGADRHQLRDHQGDHRLCQPGRGQGEEQGRGQRRHRIHDDGRLPADDLLGRSRVPVLTPGCDRPAVSAGKPSSASRSGPGQGRYGSRSFSGRPIFLPSSDPFSMSRFQIA